MKKILVIEDQEDILDGIRFILEKEKFKVITATNGEYGLMIARTYRPDLIISDIMLPGIDGFRILEELCQDPATALIPFIFLTAKTETPDFRRGMALGADDYIFKPFDVEDLLKAINVRLSKTELLKEQILHGVMDERQGALNDSKASADRIFITHNGSSIPIKYDEIACLRAENQYSIIKCITKKEYLVRKSLSDWIKVLPGSFFLRIHRSAIININHIARVEKNEKLKYNIIMENCGVTLEVSGSYIKQFKSLVLKKEG